MVSKNIYKKCLKSNTAALRLKIPASNARFVRSDVLRVVF